MHNNTRVDGGPTICGPMQGIFCALFSLPSPPQRGFTAFENMVDIVDGTYVETVAPRFGPAHELLDVAGFWSCTEFLSRDAGVVAMNYGGQSRERERDTYCAFEFDEFMLVVA